MAVWKSRLGTSIDLSGLSPQQVAELQKMANSGYGTKAAQMANQYRKAAPGGGAAGPIAPTMSQGVNNALAGNLAAGIAGGQASIGLSNADTSGPLGGTTTSIVNGKPTQTTTLSSGQQGILDQGTANTQAGQKAASGLLGGYNSFSFDPSQAQDKGFDAAYSYLTKDLDRKQSQDTDAAAQSLHDRGIPYSNDPNSRYQQEMGDIQRSYNDARTSAANQAVSTGSTLAQQQYTQGLGTHQQVMADIGTLEGSGTGLQMPNVQPFQGAQVDVGKPSDIDAAIQTLVNQGILTKAQAAMYNRQHLGGTTEDTSGLP